MKLRLTEDVCLSQSHMGINIHYNGDVLFTSQSHQNEEYDAELIREGDYPLRFPSGATFHSVSGTLFYLTRLLQPPPHTSLPQPLNSKAEFEATPQHYQKFHSRLLSP